MSCKRLYALLLTCCLLTALVIVAPAFAQDVGNGTVTPPTPPVETPPTPPAPTVPDRFNSPAATVQTFLSLANKEEKTDADREAIITCLDLSGVNAERGGDLAAKLLGIFRRTREIDIAFELKDGSAETIKTSGVKIYNLLPDVVSRDEMTEMYPDGRIDLAVVTEGEQKGYWKFSTETVANLDKFYVAVEKLPTIAGEGEESDLSPAMRIREFMPEVLKGEGKEALGVEYWQWLALLMVIFIGMVVDQVVRYLLRTIANRVITRQRARADAETIKRVVRPIGLVASALLWLWLTRYLDLPDIAYTILIAAVRIFTAFATVWAAWRLTDLVCEVAASRATRTRTKIDDILVPLARKTLKIFIFVFGGIYVANSLSVNIWPLLTGLGIGSLAFAFAARDTIENFFGSLSVILDHPFEIGDWVVIGDVEGTVEMVGFRSTRVRTFYNSQVTVPNANLVRATVDNYGRRKYRRWKTHLGVQYDTTPEQLVAFTEGIRELIRCHPYTRKEYFQVWVHQFGPSSIDILVYIFHEVADWSMELRERERLMLDIMRLADQLGVQFAFPTQTLHMYTEEHKPYEAQHLVPQSMTDRRAAVTGIRGAQKIVANQPWQNDKPGPVPYPEGPTVIDPDDDEQAAIENRTDGA